ncbi:[NiFe]-hydrogenase assembly chaperone HybE [Novosphingobium mangrovi (ex Hu et al. 2023)]|uniref:[NiFe]-hydrogenase assembly chaperone HybE n=1 Tax=Novosphingobium mangrovi (ex Hu et al. 2023) TaxID=2930094 RepID=A0ABT0ADG8_9SPHN|nr:[NiFe]-hydrogenase assembly chaperone HybE [Novosphingobium mangrovi (ex Hu et al. 2023)]MCJ1961243.1 [NiFe]-hydrogenase assembly chaperone HybE [Novosphingobium mangrovi (ex Hu et al. 2023)]
MSDLSFSDLSTRIEGLYETIARTRMADIGILNPRLGVSMRGLRRYGENHVGILVTPWFMNLLFLPVNAPGSPGGGIPPRIGSLRTFALPSGTYEGIAGHELGLGWHWSCSLFSPMFEFADMEGAVETADVSLDLLFDAPEGARGDEAGPSGSSEEFRAAMVRPERDGTLDARLAAIEAREAEVETAAQAEARVVESSEPETDAPRNLDRRALFGLRRGEGLRG